MGSTVPEVPACSTVSTTPSYRMRSVHVDCSISTCLIDQIDNMDLLQRLTGLAWTRLGWAGLDMLVAIPSLVVYTVLVCICLSRGTSKYW